MQNTDYLPTFNLPAKFHPRQQSGQLSAQGTHPRYLRKGLFLNLWQTDNLFNSGALHFPMCKYNRGIFFFSYNSQDSRILKNQILLCQPFCCFMFLQNQRAGPYCAEIASPA